jgi:hypothetical protein
MRESQWGYVIYRTVYTAESDSVWDSVIAKLDAYVHKEIESDIWEHANRIPNPVLDNPDEELVPFDPQPNQEVIAKYNNIIISNRENFDGTSIDDVANHFMDWVDDPNNLDRFRVQRQICLLIDEEVLWWLMDAPPQPPLDRNSDVYIKVVDGDYNPDASRNLDASGNPRYTGWALSKVDVLWYLWRSVEACNMETSLAFAVDTGRGLLFTG